jgi:hypothetical protein
MSLNQVMISHSISIKFFLKKKKLKYILQIKEKASTDILNKKYNIKIKINLINI